MTRALTPIIGFTFLVQIVIFLVGITNHVILSRWLGAEMFGVLATVVVLIEIVYKIDPESIAISLGHGRTLDAVLKKMSHKYGMFVDCDCAFLEKEWDNW